MWQQDLLSSYKNLKMWRVSMKHEINVFTDPPLQKIVWITIKSRIRAEDITKLLHEWILGTGNN